MDFIILGLFMAVSIVHLYASAKQNVKLRACTKVFILLALTGWYVTYALRLGAPIRETLVIALLFSWLGDVLLIPDGVKWFAIGGTSFGISHIFFIVTYLSNTDLKSVPLPVIILAAAVYVFASIMVFRVLKPHLPKALFWPMFVYLIINGAMNCFAFCQLLCRPCPGSVITFAGAMLFFASDSLLFIVRFKKDTGLKTHFPVMITYILAEFLIVWGLMLLDIK